MVEINSAEENGIHIINVIGEVDASSSIELDNALKQGIQVSKKIIVDLSKLEYISSAGLGVFISYLEDLKSKHIKLVLVDMKPKVYEVFQILGLQNLMMIADNKSEGMARLNEA